VVFVSTGEEARANANLRLGFGGWWLVHSYEIVKDCFEIIKGLRVSEMMEQ
jgi:hypothetical protein